MISDISDAQRNFEIFSVFLPGDDHKRRAFQKIIPRVVESPPEIVGFALLGDRGEVFPGSLAAEDAHVVPDPKKGKDGADQEGQEDHEECHGGVLDGDLRDHLFPPIDEKDPCQDNKKGMEYAPNCHPGSALRRKFVILPICHQSHHPEKPSIRYKSESRNKYSRFMP